MNLNPHEGGIPLYKNYDILVNKTNRLPEDYVPLDLREVRIPFDASPHDPKRWMREEAAKAAEALFARAAAAGITLYGISGYRSYERQAQIVSDRLKEAGPAHVGKYIAPAGGSEHQTGLALDVSCEASGLDLEDGFADTQEGKWLKRYAPLYGFILRYPRHKEKITGYAWEPWHIRYVTKPLSMYLTKTDLTLEEYHDLKTSISGNCQAADADGAD